jgi:hypothetical protein
MPIWRGLHFSGFLSLDFIGLVRVLARWIGLSHVFCKSAQRRRMFTSMSCVQQPSCGRREYTSYLNSVLMVGVKYDRFSEGIIGGLFEGTQWDTELTMQVHRPRSGEYLWTHVLIEEEYRTELEEIRCKSVQCIELAQNVFQRPVLVKPVTKLRIPYSREFLTLVSD